ncbi:hypothetical protein ADL22_12535 [Streptomyces sp. NRRL F-4489]|uniref:hypothetical protein n=1 Tax=Streptomyces sp. NRRL F-4489 TaxID=1609095 RepID=UPI0007483E99|nr:hypothetical protein [Streptomyces sp. NRRL F-4489]KUL44763.1 hypothetical protein ADL22_12535 [Streptomyces sp. NRRL F-4489]
MSSRDRIVERLDVHYSRQEAVDSLHHWASVVKHLGGADRFGVRIGRQVHVAGAWQWPVYLMEYADKASEQGPREMAR